MEPIRVYIVDNGAAEIKTLSERISKLRWNMHVETVSEDPLVGETSWSNKFYTLKSISRESMKGLPA